MAGHVDIVVELEISPQCKFRMQKGTALVPSLSLAVRHRFVAARSSLKMTFVNSSGRSKKAGKISSKAIALNSKLFHSLIVSTWSYMCVRNWKSVCQFDYFRNRSTEGNKTCKERNCRTRYN